MKNDYKSIMERTSKNIYNIIEKKKINRLEFCKQAGVSRSTLRRLEKDSDPILTIKSIVGLANALDVNLEELLFKNVCVDVNVEVSFI